MKIQLIRFYFLLIITVFAFIKANAQCNKNVAYYNGLFHTLHWNGEKYIIGKEGYICHEGLTKKDMDTLNNDRKYLYEKDGDTVRICGGAMSRFYNGTKWAVYNDEKGLWVSDFKYDFIFVYKPKNVSENYPYSDKSFLFVRNGPLWALMSQDGKNVSEMAYRIPAVNLNYDYLDSVIYTAKVGLSQADSMGRCNTCIEGTFYDFPLAGKLVVLEKNKKLGALDSNCKVGIPFIYDTLYESTSGCIRGYRNGKKHFVTNYGIELDGFEKVIPVLVKVQTRFSDKYKFSGIYLVMKKGSWGLYNSFRNLKTTCSLKPYDDLGSSVFYGEKFIFDGKISKKYFYVEIKMGEFIIKNDEETDITQTFLQK